MRTKDKARKRNRTGQMNWHPTPQDRAIMEAAQAKLGVGTADILRLGLRRLAEHEGLSVPALARQ